MVLLEQRDHIVVKVLAAVSFLDEASVCLVMLLDYSFLSKINAFFVPSSTLSTFEAVRQALCETLSVQLKKLLRSPEYF